MESWVFWMIVAVVGAGLSWFGALSIKPYLIFVGLVPFTIGLTMFTFFS